ncbi:MAG: biotin/lipoyl-binding protein, partial [Rhodopirellula sp. JB053]
LVREETVAVGIDRDQIRSILDSATSAVSSISVHSDLASSGIVMPGGEARACGGLSVELLPGQQRCCLAVVQSDQRNAAQMLPAMKTLSNISAASQATRFHDSAASLEPDGEDPTANSDENALVDLAHSAGDKGANAITTARELDRNMQVRAALRRFHDSLDPTATAYTIASELPRLLSCDRAVVLSAVRRNLRRPRYRVTAISGSSVVDRRAPLVRSMNRLAEKVAVLGEPIVLPPTGAGDPGLSPDSDLPPQIEDALEEYLDESGVLSVTVLPIYERAASKDITKDGHSLDNDAESAVNAGVNTASDRAPLSILLLETFSAEPHGISRGLVEVGKEAATAISNSRRYDEVFALPVRRPLAGLARATVRNWLIAMVLLVGAAAVAGWMIRVDHTVVATGVARPAQRQAVFSSVEGVVKEVLVRDGQSVSSGDVLVRLENAELTREAESLSGQLATSTQKLASLRAMQLVGDNDPRATAENAIEQGALENEIHTIGRRLEINAAMRDDLDIVAPIDGVVVGWRLDEKLRSRPINRGDRLFALVAVDGAWELDLNLDETKSGEVMTLHQCGESLPVRFAAASQPTETFHAEVSRIGGVARRRSDAVNVVDVVASVESESTPSLHRDGFHGDIDVTAKIVCPQRRLIDSLSDDLIAWFHRNVLFRFR